MTASAIVTEERIATVDTDTGWSLELFQVTTEAGERFRVEVYEPPFEVSVLRGQLVFICSMAKSIDECYERVRSFFDGEKLGHTATSLVTMCSAQVRP